MNNSSKTNTILLVILIVIALGILFFQVSGKTIFPKKQSIIQETTSQENKQVEVQVDTKNWKSFESKYLPISFKYNEAWGEPKEHYGDAKDKTCDQKMEWCKYQTGKSYQLSFTNYGGSPRICALSLDQGSYEFGLDCYKGNIPMEEYYKNIGENYTTPYEKPIIKTPSTNLLLSNRDALMWNGFGGGLGGRSVETRVITKIDTSFFQGLDITLPLLSYHEDVPDFNYKIDSFFQKILSNEIDDQTKRIIKEYEAFLSTIKIED